ncbi:alpha/beta fold hydrolase [Bacillus testis]|uniref:alpha/beta fold hydrolase n=1 Tax=Bacillus testis TaxID=1622072 RepID=UPI00067E9C58|nr:alpha/beta hydrolase [Bacillus testis]
MLHYQTYHLNENKPWITLIQGAEGDSSIWFKQLKEYRKHYNVLLIDLHGQDESNLDTLAKEVLKVLDVLQIERSHFIGISLGTVVIQCIANLEADRVETMVLGGAITTLNMRTKLCLSLGRLANQFVPFKWIYRSFAWIVMPLANQKEARQLFIEQAKSIQQSESIQWNALAKNAGPYLKKLQKEFHNIPTLFLMGEQDYLFLEGVEDIVLHTGHHVTFDIIDQAGHMCNIDQPQAFTKRSMSFIDSYCQELISIKSS